MFRQLYTKSIFFVEKCSIIMIENRGELMYTVYMIFAAIIVLSFITGNIVLLTEHKFKKEKLVLQKNVIVDEEIL